MSFKLSGAKVVSALSTFGLKYIFRRPAANFPGKIALYIDPCLIADLSKKLTKGSVVVCGTNGKTTVTNLLADALEAADMPVICNRTGANLDSGVATALLHGDQADWGVFESDELWLSKILPQLQSKYLVLLNLFRDQVDRIGDINIIQESIVSALIASPQTTLIYNADDPLCTAIAEKAPNASIALGLDGAFGQEQTSSGQAVLCQRCSGTLRYDYRQYDQLGLYHCDSCSFGRPKLDFAAHQVKLTEEGLSFKVNSSEKELALLKTSYSGTYMVYNLLATFTAAYLLGCSSEVFQRALDAYNPQNGRLQTLEIGGHPILLNLAKNPTGFDQNLKLILQEENLAHGLEGRDSDSCPDKKLDKKELQAPSSSKAVAFFVNDKEGDGRDVSWLWDVAFEEIASLQELTVFAGGIRKNDLQVRLKYAGIKADLVENASDVIAACASKPASKIYLIANYTALPPLRDELAQKMQLAPSGKEA